MDNSTSTRSLTQTTLQPLSQYVQYDMTPYHTGFSYIRLRATVQGVYNTYLRDVAVWLSSNNSNWRDTGFCCAAGHYLREGADLLIPCRTDAVSTDPASTRFVTIVREDMPQGDVQAFGVSARQAAKNWELGKYWAVPGLYAD